MHARLFDETSDYRAKHFQADKPLTLGPSATDAEKREPGYPREPHLDGNAAFDRPLFVQFCANDPTSLLGAAQKVAPYCDAVDLNLGCPQGIARKGHYGAFLQEDPNLIRSMIEALHYNLDVPVTAKMRILGTKEETLEYAKMIIKAGASIVAVHGRQRDQKGHLTGLADWDVIRYLRDSLPGDTVIFANGNILRYDDIQKCLDATGADGVMSAEGNLSDPTIFAAPPVENEETPGYWRGRDGKGGFRMDYVLRRYLDLTYAYVLERESPERHRLFVVGDQHGTTPPTTPPSWAGDSPDSDFFKPLEGVTSAWPQEKAKPPKKAKKTDSPNLLAMQPHLFHLLRPLVAKKTHVRDALAKCRAGDMAAFEVVLTMVEEVTKEAMIEYAEGSDVVGLHATKEQERLVPGNTESSSYGAVERCWRPWWICQPYVRPLPAEAVQNGAITLGKKPVKDALLSG